MVTCEHGGNLVPSEYRPLFSGHEALLASHRGWDPGALSLARALAQSLSAPLHYSRVSRLLVDLNRSLGHPRLFSPVTRHLSPHERGEILRKWYHPYRERVEGSVQGLALSSSPLLHLSVHTFTPVLEGKVRDVEVGLLYDPAREGERTFCRLLKRAFTTRLSEFPSPFRVRMNQPYQGTADGFTTALRRRRSAHEYLGIELEVSQELVQGGDPGWRDIRSMVVESVVVALGAWPPQGPSATRV